MVARVAEADDARASITMKYAAARDAEDARRRYVMVEDDGAWRELTDAEAAFLATPFEGSDGGRPYIKSRRMTRTPDGRVGGFMERSQLRGERWLRIFAIAGPLIVLILIAIEWYLRRR